MTQPAHENGNRLAAEFITRTRWSDLPAAVQEKIKLCLLDCLGATLSGTLTRVSRICADYAADAWAGQTATVLLHGRRSSAVGAAFANAAAANGLDIDDGIRYAYGHAGAQIFPAALAVAEELKLGGAQMLTAMVVGYEVAHRVGGCWHDDHEVYQACGSWGSVACAALGAHLMELSADQVQHALGIADYHAPNVPMMRDIDHPAMVKHGIPWGAMTGVSAAQLATRGFTGIPCILGDEKYRSWSEDFGRRYILLDGVVYKPKGHACCGWAQPAMFAARKLRAAHDIPIERISAIRVEAFEGSLRLGTRLPSTTEEAQFNLAWPLASMLVDGEVGPDQTLEARLGDERIRGLATKVSAVYAQDLQELCDLLEKGDPRGRFACRLSITLDDGQTFHSGLVANPQHYPDSPWDPEKVADKFRWIAGTVLPAKQVASLIEQVRSFEQIEDVGNFARALARGLHPPEGRLQPKGELH